jgi:hypothetical protein
MTDHEADNERLRERVISGQMRLLELQARLRWIRDVARDEGGPHLALVRFWESVCEELGEGR